MAENPGFPFEVDFRTHSTHFASLEEVESWLKAEESAWSWHPGTGEGGNFDAVQRQRYRDLQSHIANYKRNRQAAHANDMRNTLVKYGQSKNVLHSSRPEAKFLAELAKENNMAAAHAWAYLTSNAGPNNLAQAANGVTRAVLFKFGVTGDMVTAQKTAIEETLRDAQKRTEELRRNSDQLASDANSLVAKFRQDSADEVARAKEDSGKTLVDMGRQRDDAKAEFDAFIALSKQNLKDITETYDRKLALLAPVRYWEGRQKSHAVRALVFGLATGLTAFFGFSYSYRFAKDVFDPQKTNAADSASLTSAGSPAVDAASPTTTTLKPAAPSPTNDASSSTQAAATSNTAAKRELPPYWQIGSVILLVTLVLWVVRVLFRVVVANLHLELDAGARRVMVQTYIALSREGQLPDNESKTLVLGPLFRPTAAGLVKDEGGPTSLFEILLRLVSGGK